MKERLYLTPEQDAEFDGHMLKWQHKLGLHGWRVERSQRRAKDALAAVSVSLADRLACYGTGEWKGTEPTPANLEATACHELLHVLLHELKCVVGNSNEELAMGIEHSIVNTLEKLLLS